METQTNQTQTKYCEYCGQELTESFERFCSYRCENMNTKKLIEQLEREEQEEEVDGWDRFCSFYGIDEELTKEVTD